MTCQRARDVFAELIDSRTPATAHPEARAHLASCPDCQRDFASLTQTAEALDAMPAPAPSPRLRQNFYAMLEEEKHSAASVRAAAERRHRAQLWRWVLSPFFGCALLALGFYLGRRAQPAAPAPAPSAASQQEILALREQLNRQNDKIERMTNVVALSLLQQQSSPANARLQDVLVAAQSPAANDKVLEDLILALTLDPVPNVRLRALEGLSRHAERDVVRAGVLAALPREVNPLVQIELIDFVAAAQMRDAAPWLEKLSADETANAAVRDAAKFALAQL